MKTKITIESPEQQKDIFPMSKMKPGQICTFVSDHSGFVRRADSSKVFVEDLSRGGGWWASQLTDDIIVKPAPPGTKIILEVVED